MHRHQNVKSQFSVIYQTLCWSILIFFSTSSAQLQRTVPDETFVPGEALEVIIPFDSTSIIRGPFPIDAEGMVDLPLTGKIYVADKTPEQLQSYLGIKFAAYIKDTTFYIRPTIRLSFLGNFKRPGLFYINPDKVLWDAISVALGPLSEKELLNIHLRRGRSVERIDVLDCFSKGLTLREAGIKSGDIFIIPIPDEKNAWYYFKETITTLGSIASIATAAMSAVLLSRNFDY